MTPPRHQTHKSELAVSNLPASEQMAALLLALSNPKTYHSPSVQNPLIPLLSAADDNNIIYKTFTAMSAVCPKSLHFALKCSLRPAFLAGVQAGCRLHAAVFG